MTGLVDEIIRAPEWAPPMSARYRQAWQIAALFVGFVILYLISDRVSFIDALHGIGITAWSPSTGLIVAVLIIKGLRWSAVVLVAEALSGLTLPVVPISPAPVFVDALLVTGGYAAAVAILRR